MNVTREADESYTMRGASQVKKEVKKSQHYLKTIELVTGKSWLCSQKNKEWTQGYGGPMNP